MNIGVINNKKFLFWLMGAGIACGVLLRLLFVVREPWIGTDGVFYARLGTSLVNNGAYTFGQNINIGLIFPPVFPLTIGWMHRLIPDLFLAGKIVSLIASLITA